MNFFHRSFLIVFTCIFPWQAFGQPAHPDTLFFKDRFEPVTTDNILKTDGYYNWGASIIKGPDGQYHLFYSRWKKELKFTAWLTFSEIAHAVSDHPAGPWTYKETVLTGRGPGHWDAITAHNPKIKYFEGKYYLYYCSTNMGGRPYTKEDLIERARVGYSHPNWKILRPNQRTGVAVATSLDGPWTRMDHPLIEPSGPIITPTVNPAITRGKDGKYYLVVKGDKPVIDYLDTEDMSIWYDATRDYYYGLFHTHTFIGMVSSPDGLNWKKATEYALMPKKVLMSDGSYLQPDRLERPFMYTENGEPTVLSMAVKQGDESFNIFIPIRPKTVPLPNDRQVAWQEAEMGALFSYDLHVFDGKKYGQGGNRITPIDNYQIFNPKHLDTDQWIKAAKEAGIKFAILTVTHETGFALYQSDVNPYCMKALKYRDGKGDVVRDFVNSCRKYGVKPGLYVGIRWNSFFGVHNFQVNGEGTFRDNRQKYYNHMVEGMVKELCTNYGKLFEIWFDGGADHPDNGAPDVLPIVQQYQPDCLFYHNSQLAEARWGGSESGTVPYPCWATYPNYYSHTGNTPSEQMDLLKHGDPKGHYWMPAMSDAPLRGYNGRHEWFWEPGDESHIFPLDHLMDMYLGSVGRNSTLIIGLTPDPDGLLPEADVQRLKEWGGEIRRRFGTPVASADIPAGTHVGTHAEAPAEAPAGVRAGAQRAVPLRYIIRIPAGVRAGARVAVPIRYIILQEDIRQGERVRGYKIEARVSGKWKEIATGSCIGHKRIQPVDPVVCTKVRIRITASNGRPVMKRISVFQ